VAKFTDFGLADEVLEGVKAMGFVNPTPIQEAAIPQILDGKDIIGSAQTGTGKTAAFLLPLLSKLIAGGGHQTKFRSLIIVPTRELAIQIDQQVEGLGYYTELSSLAIYGGSDGAAFSQEKSALLQGADILICTPGRFIMHLKMGYVDASHLEVLVLDEADRMLDMGFHDDIMKIINILPKERQNLLFSATMPPKIRELAKKVLQDPVEITIALSKAPESIVQAAFIVHEHQKLPLAVHLLTSKKLERVIIFCSTKISTKSLAKALKSHDLKVQDIHSDLDQREREKVLRAFKNRELHILVATDILSRGIDIEDVEVVMNFDVPSEAEDYIHRIGRTARAASRGVAFTLVSEEDQQKLGFIESKLGKEVPKAKIPQDLGPQPDYEPSKYRSKSRGKPGRKKQRARN